MFVNYISDKGLESRVCKDLSKHPIIREQIIQLKMNKELKGDFTKSNIYMTPEYMKNAQHPSY